MQKLKEYLVVILHATLKYTKLYIKRFKTYSTKRKCIEGFAILTIISMFFPYSNKEVNTNQPQKTIETQEQIEVSTTENVVEEIEVKETTKPVAKSKIITSDESLNEQANEVALAIEEKIKSRDIIEIKLEDDELGKRGICIIYMYENGIEDYFKIVVCDILKLLKENELLEDVDYVMFRAKENMIDKYGNEVLQPSFSLDIDKEVVDKINFENFSIFNINELVDYYWKNPVYK